MPPHRENALSVPLPRPAQSVVVVDDDPGIVESLSLLLGEHGFNVEGFTDPATALDRLRAGPTPDLVLSDCLMPALTGAELMDALTKAGVDAPVVLMTALPDPGFFVDTAKVSVLNKPFQLEDLLAELDFARRPPSGPRARSS